MLLQPQQTQRYKQTGHNLHANICKSHHPATRLLSFAPVCKQGSEVLETLPPWFSWGAYLLQHLFLCLSTYKNWVDRQNRGTV